MSNCTLCRCEATHEKHGFRVCLYHLTHGEDDPSCPICQGRCGYCDSPFHISADCPSDKKIGPVIITDPDKIAGVRLLACFHAMRLEAKGLRHSSGRSVTGMIKREFSLKGNRARVLAQFEQLLRDRRILLSPVRPL